MFPNTEDRHVSNHEKSAEGEDPEDSSDEEKSKKPSVQQHAVAPETVDVFKDIIDRVRRFNPNIKERSKALEDGSKALEDGSNSLDNFVNDLLEKERQWLEKRTSTGQKNFLHVIAETTAAGGKKGVNNLKPLITELTEQYPQLPLEPDSTKTTPLHSAIKHRAGRIVDYMSDALGENLHEVLGIEDKLKNNCLHSAVGAENPKNTITTKLIPRIRSPELFCAKNIDRLTPMHLAVEYERCNSAQLAIIDAMIEHWDAKYVDEAEMDAALNVNVLSEEAEDNEERSVYRHHQWTRERSRRNESGRKGPSRSHGAVPRKEYQVKGKVHDSVEPAAGTPQAGRPATSRPTPKDQTPASVTRKENDPKSALYPQGLPRRDSTKVTEVQKQETSRDVHTTSTNLETTTKRAEEKKTKTDSAQGRAVAEVAFEPKPSGVNEQEAAADRIRDRLKMHYMCTRKDHRQIMSFLYGPDEVKQICLSFVGGPPVIQESRLKKMRYAQFDSMLHYLELPYVEVKLAEPTGAIKKEECKGRRDYEAIFRWLRGKNVKQIIHLSVEDYQPLSHSDESIEEALKDFKVIKVWDWRKLDIDSETLLVAAPEVQELVLYWSGSNAVLRGWSEPEGLNRLRCLKKITVHRIAGLETETRARSCLEKFKRRMEQLRPKVKLDPNQQGNSSTDKPSTSKTGPPLPEIEIKYTLDQASPLSIGINDTLRLEDDHPQEAQKWIACMKHFARYSQTLLKQHAGKKPVTVALIDDGVDFADERIASMLEGGRSDYQRANKLIAPFWTSSGGHGTAMAGLIRTVCPVAKLFVIRLNEYFSQDGRRQIYADSAARAIRAAIAKGVDIISMSWTINQTDNNMEGIKKLEAAVMEAAKRNILMFCAASDQGISEDKSFPGKTRDCIKIGAATNWGTAHKSLGPNNPVDYIFPGQSVVRDGGGDQVSAKENRLIGSSVATAFASGLAALILRCVQLAAQILQEEGETYGEEGKIEEAKHMEKHLKALKARERMQEAFEQIGLVSVSSTKYVEVWNVFEAPGTKTEDYDQQRMERWILDIARKLVGQRRLTGTY